MREIIHTPELVFNPEFLSAQKKKLQDERERIKKELEKIGGAYPDYGTETEDNVAEEDEFATNTSVRQSLETELERVSTALGRIEKGTYGLDINTGKPIAKKRLEACPAAETII